MNTRNTWVSALTAVALLSLCPLLPPAGAQDTATEATDELITIRWPNEAMISILEGYEELTGNKIIRDVTVLGTNLTIDTSRKMTRAEAAEFIEQSLLLNGFALIPAGKNTLKIIATGAKQPSDHGVPVFTRPEDLPESEEVVTFLMGFTHLDTEEATRTLTQIFPGNAYGAFTPIPQASVIAITGNTTVIRKILEVREKIDLPPSTIEHETITLERADATQVAEALVEILGLDTAASSASSRSGRGPSTLQAANQAQQQARNQQNAQAARQASAAGEGSQAVQPKIRAIPLANRILVVARPVDMEYIKRLIGHFDEPIEKPEMVKHQLNYLSVATFLPIVEHSLLRGLGDETTQGGAQIAGGVTGAQQGGGVGSQGGNVGGNSGFGSQGGQLGGQSRFGGSGGSGGFGGSRGGSGFGSSGGIAQDVGPQSLVIDKTLLVADNVQNTLMVSGPSEHQAIIQDLLDELDRKPRQIRLTAIIAQLTLGDDFEYGFDLIRTLETQGIDGRRNNGAGVFKSRTGALNRILDINDLDQVDNFLPANQGLTLYGQINPYLNAYLHLLQQTNRFKVLSRPAIYTLNNRPASIFSGQRIAVPRTSQTALTGTGATPVTNSSIEFEEVILRIEVHPLINAEDNITLKISQLNDDIVGTNTIDGNEIPIIGTQQLDTTVIVPDGGTVLLGGLISDEETKSRSGLPLFFNNPMFENVLGSKTRERDRQELLIFIQPQIIDNEEDMNKADAEIDEDTAISEEIEDFNPPAAKVRPVGSKPSNQKSKPGFFKRLFGTKAGSFR